MYIEIDHNDDLYIHIKPNGDFFICTSAKEYNQNEIICRLDIFIRETIDYFLKEWFI